jgi:multidrug efflux pump subunit AcrB
VATAWAASRRSLATAAFLAGFAILATALFTAALYGATIAASLVMAGVVLMAVGAAAAWQKQTGEE